LGGESLGISVSGFLSVVASLATIGAAVAVVIRYVRDEEKRNPQLVWGTIGVTTAIVVVAVIVSQTVSVAINGQSTIPITFGRGPTAPPAVNTTPSASATAPSETLTENITLDCTSQPRCDIPLLSPVIDSIQIDQQKRRMLWTITFTNNTNGVLTGIAIYMNTFQDSNGNNWEGQMQETSDTFDLASGQSVQRHYEFPVVPRTGKSYTYFFSITSGPGYGLNAYVTLLTF
jgi:hypothetical protein